MKYKRPLSVLFRLHEVSRKGKFSQTANRQQLPGAEGWERASTGTGPGGFSWGGGNILKLGYADGCTTW